MVIRSARESDLTHTLYYVAMWGERRPQKTPLLVATCANQGFQSSNINTRYDKPRFYTVWCNLMTRWRHGWGCLVFGVLFANEETFKVSDRYNSVATSRLSVRIFQKLNENNIVRLKQILAPNLATNTTDDTGSFGFFIVPQNDPYQIGSHLCATHSFLQII